MLCKQLGPGLNCSVVDAVRTGALISMAMSARLATVLGRVRVLVPSSNFRRSKTYRRVVRGKGRKALFFYVLKVIQRKLQTIYFKVIAMLSTICDSFLSPFDIPIAPATKY